MIEKSGVHFLMFYPYRVSEHLSKASANIARPDIEKWFKTISDYIKAHPNILEALQDSSRVFNAEESFFRLDTSSGRALAP